MAMTLAFVVAFFFLVEGSFIVKEKDYGLTEFDGYIGGVGDLDGDKSTDVILIKNESSIRAAVWRRSSLSFVQREAINVQKLSNNTIETVVGLDLADFDGDGFLDVLVYGKSKKNGNCTQGIVLWRNESGFRRVAPFLFNASWSTHPLVLVADGDLLPDIWAADCAGVKSVLWLGRPNRTFLGAGQLTAKAPWSKPESSSGFVDLNGDCVADVWTLADNRSVLDVWTRQTGGSWMKESRIPVPIHSNARPSFADINADGSIDIVAVAENGSGVMLFNRQQSSTDCVEIDDFPKAFRKATYFDISGSVATLDSPDWIRFGDVNLDTYPDLLVIRSVPGSKNKAKHRTFFLYTNTKSAAGGRTFEPYKDLSVDGDVASVIFFDIEDNGIMDILMNVKTDKGNIKTVALLNQIHVDSEFLRVSVLSGYCPVDASCASHPPFGVIQLGALIKFSTTGPQGDKVMSAAGHISVSGPLACPLPYVIFGLSRTSNFIEKLQVGIPYVNSKGGTSHSWSSIIPNSLLFILPQAEKDSWEWKNILYLTPSNGVWYTLTVFSATCLLFGIVVGLLHWREKRQDEREKRQEAHKFHFDAM
eukprot:m.310832 g.310832  ORF g.310832 m.310832 type:complete len:589 (+) comp55388_c0_seq1:24-1790(+)